MPMRSLTLPVRDDRPAGCQPPGSRPHRSGGFNRVAGDVWVQNRCTIRVVLPRRARLGASCNGKTACDRINAGATPGADVPGPVRCGFTLVELLVVLAVIGVLVGLLLPAVQAAREAMRQADCGSRLHNIGLGLHNYHATFGKFPPGAFEVRPQVRGGKQFAWSAFILPQIEQGGLFERIDFGRAFDDPVNQAAAAVELAIYVCPSTPRDQMRRGGLGATDFGGIYGERIMTNNTPPRGAMIHDTALGTRDFLDGTAATMIVAEDADFPDGQWINGRNLFDQAFAPNGAPKFENDIRSFHPGGAMTLHADGATHFITEQIDLEVLAARCTRNGRETIIFQP